MFGLTRTPLKTSDEIVAMRRAGLVTGSALRASALAAEPGMTTKQLDAVAEQHMRAAGATPSFRGYQGFPATLCISVNDEVVHGIPGDRVLADGDVVSLDCGAIIDGWHGDSALTFVVGAEGDHPAGARAVAARHAGQAPRLTEDEVASSAQEYGPAAGLVLATEASLYSGIRQLRVGERLNLVGVAIEDLLRVHLAHVADFEIVDGYTGHGVGRALHEEPTVYNEEVREKLPKIKPGLVVAVEPMVTAGTHETHELDDGWTVKTDDGSLAAHFEHTVAVMEAGLWILTAEDGGRAALGPLYGGLD